MFDDALARRYHPIIYDPYEYGDKYNPGAYFRIVCRGNERCIQYFYYWDKQDCKSSYLIMEPNTVGSIVGFLFGIAGFLIVSFALDVPSWMARILEWSVFIALFLIGGWIGYTLHNELGGVFEGVAGFFIGRFFSHDYDFEPILVFVEEGNIVKVAISGRGDLDATPHRNDIFAPIDSYAEGECDYYTSERPYYPLGRQGSTTAFKEFSLAKIRFEDNRPSFAVVTCYHAFTASSNLYGEEVFKRRFNFELRQLNDDVLEEWYGKKNFGHDVADPFTLPYIKFSEPEGATQFGRRKYVLGFLEALSLVMQGLIKMKNLVYFLLRAH